MKRLAVILGVVFAGAVRADVEATPESQGVSSVAIQKWIDAVERDVPDFHSFVLRRHGKVIAEGWWAPYAKELPHRLFSHSKVFTSTAAGFVADEGKLDLDERVAEIFPDKMPANPGESVRQLRVRDLLTMNTGGACDRPMHVDPFGDWMKAFLADDFKRRPGTHFNYNSCATYMVAEIVERKTGRKMMDYLDEKLFRPLGMTGVETTYAPSGCPCGGWGMAAKTEDLAKLGQLFLDGGRWNGREIISRNWVQLATAKHTWNNCTPGKGDPKNDWQQGYGFQWWRCQHNCYRADGAGGQFTIVMPDQDAVISCTAVLCDFQGAFNKVWDILLPAMADKPLAADDAAVKALRERCAKLALPTPKGARACTDGRAGGVACTTGVLRWALKPNKGRYSALVFEPDADGWKVSLEGGKRPLRMNLGYGTWRPSTVRLNDRAANPLHSLGLQGDLKLAAAGAWQGAKFHGRGWFVNEAANGGLDIDLSGDTMKGAVYCWNPCEPKQEVAFEASDREMPVFAWNYYAFTNRLDDATTIANWKDLGLNAPLSPRVDGKTDKKAFRAFLDKCYDAGIRPFVYDTRIADTDNIFRLVGEKCEGAETYRKLVKEVVADWGDHPAVRGFYVCDEPEAKQASAAFRAARIQREEAPHLQPFLNLLPWFDWIGPRVGAKSLGEYLDRAKRESGIGFLGYDCYSQQTEGHLDKDVGPYFHNLREWAEFGKRSGSSWNTTLLCVPHFHYRIDSADDFRWQISTAAAMGAKGISWFYPDHHTGPHLNYRDAPVNAFGERTPTFTWMANEMRYFNHQFAAAFMGLNWEKAFIVGKTYGGIPSFVDAADGKSGTDADLVSVKGDNMLVSFFTDAAGVRHAAIVNLSRTSPQSLNVTFAPEVGAEIRNWNGWQKLVDPYDPLRTDKRGTQKVWQPLSPGQLVLLRLCRSTTH